MPQFLGVVFNNYDNFSTAATDHDNQLVHCPESVSRGTFFAQQVIASDVKHASYSVQNFQACFLMLFCFLLWQRFWLRLGWIKTSADIAVIIHNRNQNTEHRVFDILRYFDRCSLLRFSFQLLKIYKPPGFDCCKPARNLQKFIRLFC